MITVIGGNKLSSFYSTALFVPFSSQTVFTPFANQQGGFSIPFGQATTRQKPGIQDVTDSDSPYCRTRFQTEGDWDCMFRAFLNPDNPPRSSFTPAANSNGFQLYLTLSAASMYPAGDTPRYWWIPRVLAEEIPHRQQLNPPPALVIDYDLHIVAASPAFFLPDDFTSGLIAQFEAYCADFTPNPWGW
jgi:hypothetical protein